MAQNPWTYPRIIAHRCGGALAPENTLSGLRMAARLGFRAVEFDVMLSADGVPLLIHDETVERTCNATGEVAKMPFVTLRKLDAGGKHHCAFAGELLPTFQEALAACLALGLAANVEIKPATGHEKETGRKVAQVAAAFVEEHPLAILMSSFSAAALGAAHSAAPRLPRALLVEAIPPDWQARLQEFDCCAVHCDAQQLRAEQLAEIHAFGIPLACYTVNRPELAAELFAGGVTTIFSDRLDLFDGDGNPWR
jgi:glycerophosphoryl diester phosphodiesterase